MHVTRSLNRLAPALAHLVKSRLWLQVIIALVLGTGLGIALNPRAGLLSAETSAVVGDWLGLPGTLFLRLVQMVMIPLIVTSILTGIVSNSSEQLRRMGGGLMAYFLFTSVLATTIGLTVAYLTEPGLRIARSGGFGPSPGDARDDLTTGDLTGPASTSLPDSIGQLIPDNPLEAILHGEMLGVVIFTVIIGVAVTRLTSEQAHPLIRLAESIQRICMTVVSWAMKLVPVAVFGLMAALLADIGIEVLAGLGYFVATVLGGLLLLALVYMVILRVLAGRRPLQVISAIRDPLLLAFSTASSAAVMPLSMTVADKRLGVRSSVSDFVIPVGATVNMDGTALFQAMTAVFIAQAYGMEIPLAGMVLITATIVASSIGTPAVPGGGVIVLASVLQSAGIPTEGLVIVIGIDRILGMFRTSVNVFGDLTACVVFDRWTSDPAPDDPAPAMAEPAA